MMGSGVLCSAGAARLYFNRVTDACLGPIVRRLAALGVPVCAATTPTTGTTSLGDPPGDVSGRNLFNVRL